MAEREPRKEAIGQSELYFLWHSTTPDTFSGYGLTIQPGSKEGLVGLLMVDRPNPVDPKWLAQIEATFGEYDLMAMATTGERGIACHTQIESDSQSYLRQLRRTQPKRPSYHFTSFGWQLVCRDKCGDILMGGDRFCPIVPAPHLKLYRQRLFCEWADGRDSTAIVCVQSPKFLQFLSNSKHRFRLFHRLGQRLPWRLSGGRLQPAS